MNEWMISVAWSVSYLVSDSQFVTGTRNPIIEKIINIQTVFHYLNIYKWYTMFENIFLCGIFIQVFVLLMVSTHNLNFILWLHHRKRYSAFILLLSLVHVYTCPDCVEMILQILWNSRESHNSKAMNFTSRGRNNTVNDNFPT